MTATAEDFLWMARALRLAERGLYTTTPNPRVGCVLVKDGQVIGEGWHVRAGDGHAEVHALMAAGEQAKGATAYVTLEPCSHTGRTPPCADALVKAGVARVVVAMQDPNPLVAGRGIQRLMDAGIRVLSGVLGAAAAELNRGFVTRMTTGRPWVRLKLGVSLDGRTALANGRSQWITSPTARSDVQRLRARSCAIITGINTVLVDEARLTVREFLVERQPQRVILDSRLQLSAEAPILLMPGVQVVYRQAATEAVTELEKAGAVVWQAAESDGRIHLAAVLDALGQQGKNEVLVESGPGLAGAFLKAGLVDELVIYQAGLTLGSESRGMFDGLDLSELVQAQHWDVIDRRAIGPDWRINYVKGASKSLSV